MTLAQRIKTARVATGLSQQALADAISTFGDGRKVSRTAIAQWESEATKEIEAANLLKAARILNVAPEWLRFGTGRMRADPAYLDGLLFITADAMSVPILNYVQAAKYMEQDKDTVKQIGIDPELAKAIGVQAFALIVKGDSMSPVLKLGDIVVIDPDTKPRPGEIVAVELPSEGAMVLRKYRPLGKDRLGVEAFELVPFNEDWPRIVINSSNPGRIVGTLVEHRCRRRLFAKNGGSNNGATAKATSVVEIVE